MCDMLHIKQNVWHSLKYKGSYIYIFKLLLDIHIENNKYTLAFKSLRSVKFLYKKMSYGAFILSNIVQHCSKNTEVLL